MKQDQRRHVARVPFTVMVMLLAAAPTKSVRAQSFEGVVEFSITTEQGTIPMTYLMKGDNIRVEMEGPGGRKGTVLMDAKEGKSVMLMDQMKMYMELPTPPPPDSSEAKPEITKTGKTQKILGYECQQFIIKDAETKSEVWVTKDLGTFRMAGMGRRDRGSRAEAWQKIIGSEGAFPLQATTQKGDEQVSKMIATKIEKKSLDESLFKIPEGYKKFDASMMRGPR